ncbi:MAG: hypothetical protein CMG29_06005 [Candidatus Marinimicrobia bacterium]|jgi:copper chaperone CopZ/membrane-bound metal-dependent hydrolase YbcI (DUF457 family)|nr:hypothetical protein [Candidatus Neomarinimicrobiota bacterium]
MFVPSHIASGYLIGRAMKQSSWTTYPFIPVLLFASIFPDIDGLFSATVAGHHSILHTPIFWIIIIGGMSLLNVFLKIDVIKPISFGIILGAQLHLFTDWLTARTVGIQWLYPFSAQNFHVYDIYPEQGQIPVFEMIVDPYWSFYMENKVLFGFELGLNFVVLFFLIKNSNHIKMKRNIMKHVLITLAIIGLIACGDDTTKADIALATMQCGMCEDTIEEGVKALDGIVAFDVDPKTKVGHVEFKAGMVDLSAIENAIAALGYDANNTKVDAAAYDALPDCCKVGSGH